MLFERTPEIAALVAGFLNRPDVGAEAMAGPVCRPATALGRRGAPRFV